jgi:hypothetical protein
MSSRKRWVAKGWYDNLETQRRERYDHRGNVIESQGVLYVARKPGHHGKFGKLPDVPKKPFNYKEPEDETS